MTVIEANILYALAWLSFGFGHSWLARAPVKARLELQVSAYYRLLYNLSAAAHFLGIWLLGKAVFGASPTFLLFENVQMQLSGIAYFGLFIIIMAVQQYDRGRFAGTTQIYNHWKGIKEPEDEPFRATGFNAYVRHPIYTGAYLFLWGNAQNELGLATAIWGSTYLMIVAMYEERHLLRLYGEDYREYREYRQMVPAVIPWRGKAV